MSEENTQQAEQAAAPVTESAETTDLIEGLISEYSSIFSSPTDTEVQPEPAKETKEAAEQVQAVPNPKEGTEEPTEAGQPLSPLLAERSRREREARAEIETLKGSTETAVAEAKQALVDELVRNPRAFIAKHNIKDTGDLALHFYAADRLRD